MYEFWRTPVTNRTQQDVDYKTDKGFLNASDLTRIEGNQGTIARDFQIPISSTEKWQMEDFLFSENAQKIVNNTKIIQRNLNINVGLYSTVLHWLDLNTIERIMFEARRIYLLYIDWDCWECLFDIWDDFDRIVIDWDYLEKAGLCSNDKNWDLWEYNFTDWDIFEILMIDWDFLECEGGL